MREKPVCRECGSDDITFDSISVWDEYRQNFVTNTVLDTTFCDNCGDCRVDWIDIPKED